MFPTDWVRTKNHNWIGLTPTRRDSGVLPCVMTAKARQRKIFSVYFSEDTPLLTFTLVLSSLTIIG